MTFRPNIWYTIHASYNRPIARRTDFRTWTVARWPIQALSRGPWYYSAWCRVPFELMPWARLWCADVWDWTVLVKVKVGSIIVCIVDCLWGRCTSWRPVGVIRGLYWRGCQSVWRRAQPAIKESLSLGVVWKQTKRVLDVGYNISVPYPYPQQ